MENNSQCEHCFRTLLVTVGGGRCAYDEGWTEKRMGCVKCGKVFTIEQHHIWELEKKVQDLESQLGKV